MPGIESFLGTVGFLSILALLAGALVWAIGRLNDLSELRKWAEKNDPDYWRYR